MAVLGVIVLFIYSVVSFAWLHSYFSPRGGQFCDTLAQCFYSVLRIGLLDTLGTVWMNALLRIYSMYLLELWLWKSTCTCEFSNMIVYHYMACHAAIMCKDCNNFLLTFCRALHWIAREPLLNSPLVYQWGWFTISLSLSLSLQLVWTLCLVSL